MQVQHFGTGMISFSYKNDVLFWNTILFYLFNVFIQLETMGKIKPFDLCYTLLVEIGTFSL